MIGLDQLLLFSLASLVLIFTPGPDIIYVLTRGVAQGRGAALAAAAGFSLGNVAHTMFAVAGLSALVASSATAFTVVRLAGGAYLIWLGIRIFRSPSVNAGGVEARHMSKAAVFRQSVLANVLNPKVAVFFLAFFPQFVDREAGAVAGQMLILGGVFVVLTFVGFALVAWGSGFANAWLAASPRAGRRLNQGAGSVLVLLGLRLAVPQG